MAFLGFGGTGIQVLAYSGHMLYPRVTSQVFPQSTLLNEKESIFLTLIFIHVK